MPPPQPLPTDPLQVLEALQRLEALKIKSIKIQGLMHAVEKAACDGIVEVINNYLDATYASLELDKVEADALESDNELHDIQASLARLKTGLPPFLA